MTSKKMKLILLLLTQYSSIYLPLIMSSTVSQNLSRNEWFNFIPQSAFIKLTKVF